MAKIDHLVFASPDLAAGTDHVARVTGVQPGFGGSHPGWGTANSLASLGDSYLEIIGVDPEQPTPDAPRPFDLDAMSPDERRLVTFAIAPEPGESLDDLVDALTDAGHAFNAIRAMSRTRPDGVTLAWRLATPRHFDGPVPFVIDWGATPHPSAATVTGLQLQSLEVATPDAGAIGSLYDALALDVSVRAADAARLVATVTGPDGQVELR